MQDKKGLINLNAKGLFFSDVKNPLLLLSRVIQFWNRSCSLYHVKWQIQAIDEVPYLGVTESEVCFRWWMGFNMLPTYLLITPIQPKTYLFQPSPSFEFGLDSSSASFFSKDGNTPKHQLVYLQFRPWSQQFISLSAALQGFYFLCHIIFFLW
jgi:hypothetical protein